MSATFRRILVADDDPGTRSILRATLQGADFEVTVAADGLEAMERFRADPSDLVILDVDMPGLSGYEVCTRLRREFGALLPIVMVTGLDDVGSVDAAYQAGATDFIAKPVNWVILVHRIRHLLRNYRSVLDLHEAEARIRRLAYFDTLTGLPNREHFHARLARCLEVAAGGDQRFAMLSLDLDKFKRINDTLGHGIGDELLHVTAARLREAVRAGDPVAHARETTVAEQEISRLGGDEFMVLLPALATPNSAALVAERIVQSLGRPMRLGGHDVLVTPSIGIAIYPDDGEDQETLVKSADLAMYAAKRRGGAGYAFFDATMNSGALKRLTIEGRLRNAISNDEFSLNYQPQFELQGNRICGFEALLRWNNAELGPVPPSDFIQVAEDAGLILSIGEYVLRAACNQMCAWQAEGIPPVRVSVNVSGLQLSQPGFPDFIRQVLEETRLPPALLEIEITESVVMRDESSTADVLRQIKALGVEIAIDDFGTGYSSFARLREFPIDRLKLDRSLIQNIHSSHEDHAIATAIITMATTLRMEAVAEGVEHCVQLEILRDQGCTLAQGYYLSHPLPAHAARQLLLQRQPA